MRIVSVLLISECLCLSIFAQEQGQKQESKAPVMVSFAGLKWVELAERKGMQFAQLKVVN